MIEVLEKSKVPLSAQEIADCLESTNVKIDLIICKLLKHNEVKCVELNKDLAMKFFKCKRKMRLYYL